MGASSFSNVIVAMNAEEAFRAAVDWARAEYGHGPYTGTIAEKHGFTILALPEGVRPNEFIAALKADDIYQDDFRSGKTAFLPHENWRPGCYIKVSKTGKRMLKGPIPIPRNNPFSDKYGPAGCLDIGPATATNLKRNNIHRPLIAPEAVGQSKKSVIAGVTHFGLAEPKRGSRVFLFFGIASD